MADFWVVGPVAWDWVLRVPCLPPSGGFVQAGGVAGRPGGAGANAAVALASTGAAVHMAGYVGDDEPGARLRAVLGAAGVDIRFLRVLGGHTSEVVILVEPSGERTIIGVHPDLLHTVPVPDSEIRPRDVVYFAAWRDEFLPAMTKLTCSGAHVATVPPPVLAPGFPAAYVVGSDAQYGGQVPVGAIPALTTTARAIVVTQGARGVVVHDHDGSAAYPAQPVPAVDTTGAGDAFAAGFLYQIAEGGTHAHAAATGIAWATAAVQVPASIPPPWAAVPIGSGDHPQARR